MELSLTSKRTTLKTAQKYCSTDITIDVAVQDKSVTPGSAPQTVTADTGYAGLGTVTVAPAIEDVSTADGMQSRLVSANIGKMYRFTGTTDDTYTNGDLYEVVSE